MIFKTKPREYQQKIFDEFKDKEAFLLAIGMSGGKSKLVVDFHNYHKFQKTIIVAPNRVKQVWVQQFFEHSTDLYLVRVMEGTKTQKEKTFKQFLDSTAKTVLVLNYESIWRSPWFNELMKHAHHIDAIILDEVHNIKNPTSNQSKACWILGKHIQYRYGLSGTIISESYIDIFGQMKFIDQSVFGTAITKFRNEYCNMGEYPGQVKSYKNLDKYFEKLKPYWAFVPQSEVDKGLPPISSIIRDTELPNSIKKLYIEMKKEGILRNLDYVSTSKNILDRYIKLRQIVSGHIIWEHDTNPSYTEILHQEKLYLLEETLQEISLEEPIVIFTSFTKNVELISDICKKNNRSVAQLTGQANQLEYWQQGNANTLVVNTATGNSGISLTRACYNIYYDLPYSLTQFLQSEKRTHRSGQERPVVNIYLIIKNTIDEDIYHALQNKLDVVEYVKMRLQYGSS